MNRADVKLMIDRLNAEFNYEDSKVVSDAIDMLGALADENAKLQGELEYLNGDYGVYKAVQDECVDLHKEVSMLKAKVVMLEAENAELVKELEDAVDTIMWLWDCSEPDEREIDESLRRYKAALAKHKEAT